MIVESISISILFILMIFMFCRSKKYHFAFATAPLLVVPVLNVIFNVLRDYLKFKTDVTTHMLFLVIALAIAVLAIGLQSYKMKTKKTKIIYLITAGGFTTLLTIIFLYNLYFA